MKRGVFILFFVGVASLHLLAHVELKSPEGGETYHPGDTVSITWAEIIRHNTLDWDLLYSVDGGQTWISLKADIPLEVLSYQWLVPDVSSAKTRIKVVQDNEGEDYESSSPNFTIASITGIRDPKKPAEIKVFPNPMTDFATIEFENLDHDYHSLSIYNTRGEMVRSFNCETSGKIDIQRGNLSAGFYFIQLKRERPKTLSVGKLVIR